MIGATQVTREAQMTRWAGARSRLRYRWSHRHPVHRALVRSANRVLPFVPFPVKYAVTDRVRRRRLPYRLLGPGRVAIQVGAPRDTLLAGRSRAMAFARLTHPGGRVLVVEPDRASVEEFRRVSRRQGLSHVTVVHAAAWSERATLELAVDSAHPATNFVAGAADYSPEERARFHTVSVEAIPLDELVEEAGLSGLVDVVSVTTNGAEEAILQGLRRTLARDRPYVCLARTADSYSAVMAELGYALVGDDDRGFTFRHEGG